MPITKSALKALRKDKRKTANNRPVRSRVKTALDAVKEAKTPQALSGAFSAIDKAVKRHILHKNTAARMKSKASKLIK